MFESASWLRRRADLSATVLTRRWVETLGLRLVEPEVWYQVQSVLAAHNASGDRTQNTTTTSRAPCSAGNAG